jgi:rhodanese-related sulfurtransferase
MSGLEVMPADLAKMLLQENPPHLLDVRNQWEHECAALEGSQLIPLDALSGRLEEIPRDRKVVVYCHHGIRSLVAAHYLRDHGLEALSLHGGIDQWSAEIDPRISRY